eukprot:5004372-Lingulodinium_polyedra.AAC.1
MDAATGRVAWLRNTCSTHWAGATSTSGACNQNTHSDWTSTQNNGRPAISTSAQKPTRHRGPQ